MNLNVFSRHIIRQNCQDYNIDWIRENTILILCIDSEEIQIFVPNYCSWRSLKGESSLITTISNTSSIGGAQWLSGRVLDLRSKGDWLETHQRPCAVSLSKILPLLSTGSNQEDRNHPARTVN